MAKTAAEHGNEERRLRQLLSTARTLKAEAAGGSKSDELKGKIARLTRLAEGLRMAATTTGKSKSAGIADKNAALRVVQASLPVLKECREAAALVKSSAPPAPSALLSPQDRRNAAEIAKLSHRIVSAAASRKLAGKPNATQRIKFVIDNVSGQLARAWASSFPSSLAESGIEAMVRTALTGYNSMFGNYTDESIDATAGAIAKTIASEMPLAAKAAITAGLLVVMRKKDSGGKQSEAFSQESGWDLAIKRSQPRPAMSHEHDRGARRRIRAAATSAFAAALDQAVDAGLLTRFAAKHPGGVDAAKLRRTYVDAAVRRFAAEFVKLVGGAPPASAEDIALGAIIAVAIAETTTRFPIVPPGAVAPMAVVVHRALRPQLQALARAAAVAGAAPNPTRPRPVSAGRPVHELAW